MFRKERLDEPLELYSQFFEAFVPVFDTLIDKMCEIARSSDAAPDVMGSVFRAKDERTAFRYLAAPPISEDDLRTLADSKLSASSMRRDRDQAMRVRDLILHIIDPHRFPWLKEMRSPDRRERERSIVASAALVAAKKVETARRVDAQKQQEQRVRLLLTGELGFAEAPRRPIAHIEDAPGPGEFCGECKLGDTRADLIVRLWDRRVMPIECKVSNSAVNSFKRLNHEAVGKADKWFRDFGRRSVVPSAVLSGVFHPANLEIAQAAGLALFWAFRLPDLADFVRAAR